MLPPHIFILFELDIDVKFPLLRLLLFLSDLKSTINEYPLQMEEHHDLFSQALPGYGREIQPIQVNKQIMEIKSMG